MAFGSKVMKKYKGKLIARRSLGCGQKTINLFFLFLILFFMNVHGVLVSTASSLGNFGLTFTITSEEPLSLTVGMVSPSSGQAIETAVVNLAAGSADVAICRMSTNKGNTKQTFNFSWTPFVLVSETIVQSFGYDMVLEVNSQDVATEGSGHTLEVDVPAGSGWVQVDVCTFRIVPNHEVVSSLPAGTYRATIRVEVKGA